MRCLKRNKQTLYYALYQSKTELTDSFGNLTGQYAVAYSPLRSLRTNISAAKGTLEAEQFGINADYAKTFVVNDLSCPITEGTVLWVGFDTVKQYRTRSISAGDIVMVNGNLMKALIDNPTENDFTAVAHNYVVTKVAKSKNFILYAIEEVSVS